MSYIDPLKNKSEMQRLKRIQLWDGLFSDSDIIEIRALKGVDGPRKRWFGTKSELLSKWSEFEAANAEGFDIYFGVNPRPCKGAGKASDIQWGQVVIVDLDPAPGETTVPLEKARIEARDSGIPYPSIVVHSGRGIHLYWILEAPVPVAQWTVAVKNTIARFASADKKIHDAPRIMRLPGFKNHKSGTVSEIVYCSGTPYPIETFTAPRQVPPKQPEPLPPSPTTSDSAARARKYLEKKPGVGEGQRNAACFEVSCLLLADFALPPLVALPILAEWNMKNSPPLEDRELQKAFKSARVSAKGKLGAKDRPMPSRSAPTSATPEHQPSAPTAPVSPLSTDQTILESLAANCVLIIGTTQVWHESMGMSMPLEALRAMHPNEVKVWSRAKDKRSIMTRDIVFEPDTSKVLPGQINLFRGLPLATDPRPIPALLEHCLYLCNYNTDLFSWLMSWMALPLQRPGTKLDTAVIMQGPQGSGKSMLFSCLREIYGEYGRKITQGTLESQYTGWMSRKLFIQAEEVCSTRGQRNKIRNLIKDWVTGEVYEISEKYQVSREESAHANFVFLSNDDVPLPIDHDDRRFLVIRNPEPKTADYYAALGADVTDNGPARFCAELMRWNLGSFWAHSHPPSTEAKRDLSDLCKPSHQVFVEEWKSGEIERLPYMSCLTSDLYHAYSAWARLDGAGYCSDRQTFSKYCAKVLDRRRTHEGRYYHVDSADVTRFENKLKCYITYILSRRV